MLEGSGNRPLPCGQLPCHRGGRLSRVNCSTQLFLSSLLRAIFLEIFWLYFSGVQKNCKTFQPHHSPLTANKSVDTWVSENYNMNEPNFSNKPTWIEPIIFPHLTIFSIQNNFLIRYMWKNQIIRSKWGRTQVWMMKPRYGCKVNTTTKIYLPKWYRCHWNIHDIKNYAPLFA